MKPRMSRKEFALYFSFITHADTYMEFGCGGSTFVASHYVKESILSVDSSTKWIEMVKKECDNARGKVKPNFFHTDIGSLGDWGTPNNEAMKEQWPNYHSEVWGTKGTWGCDLYFIDGRFRVACFAQIYRRAKCTSIVGVHDFLSREKHYGAIRELGKEIASAEDISFFSIIPDKMKRSQEIIDDYRYNHR